MESFEITKEQARRFLLRKQGLCGKPRFSGKEGVLAYIRQAGCIQFDPVDICGRNADLTLQARVSGYKRSMAEELLYSDVLLVDGFDKNLSIYPVEDWTALERQRLRESRRGRSSAELETAMERIRRELAERGALCSTDLDMDEKVDWYWSPTRLARAALERMYLTGELVVHHKKGTIKYYDFTAGRVAAEQLAKPCPYSTEEEYYAWHIRRRIGAVGLLWNRPSDAWLCIHDLKAAERAAAFSRLAEEGSIAEVRVEGVKHPLYMQSEDAELLEECKTAQPGPRRCELIAPLDPMLWDRKLILELFDFDYKWEIYTPNEQRKYCAYPLPLLLGESFVGRMELVREGKVMHAKRLWTEAGVKLNKGQRELLKRRLRRFAEYSETELELSSNLGLD